MNYICKNCGAFISEEEFKKDQEETSNALGCGCLIWLIILLCCVSIILLPIAIILVLKEFNKTPNSTCPYCQAKDSLIPETSPIAKKMIAENYTQEQKDEIAKIHEKQKIKKQEDNELEQKNTGIALGTLIFIIVIAILMAIFK